MAATILQAILRHKKNSEEPPSSEFYYDKDSFARDILLLTSAAFFSIPVTIWSAYGVERYRRCQYPTCSDGENLACCSMYSNAQGNLSGTCESVTSGEFDAPCQSQPVCNNWICNGTSPRHLMLAQESYEGDFKTHFDIGNAAFAFSLIGVVSGSIVLGGSTIFGAMLKLSQLLCE